jgi:hypothetical protein
MAVWAVWTGLSALGGAIDGWSPELGGAIGRASFVLVLPAMISSAIRVVRGRPGWLRFVGAWAAALAASVAADAAVDKLFSYMRLEAWYIDVAVLPVTALAFWILYRLWPAPLSRSLNPDRFGAVLEEGERPLAAVQVRVSGTQPLRLVLAYGTIGLGVVLGFGVLGAGPSFLIFLPFVLVMIPGLCLMVAIGNDWGERRARRGRRRSVARSYPRSGGALGMWPLVLTDRRLVVVRTGRGGRMDLVWSLPRTELTGAAAAGRSLRTWDPTIRLHFTDSSSIRLTAPGAEPFLTAFG